MSPHNVHYGICPANHYDQHGRHWEDDGDHHGRCKMYEDAGGYEIHVDQQAKPVRRFKTIKEAKRFYAGDEYWYEKATGDLGPN